MPILCHMIWVGEFNEHHPIWSGTDHPRCCHGNTADLLIQLIMQHNLALCSPYTTPTYQSDAHGTWSTLDLVLSTPDIEGHILSCLVDPTARLPGADHLPICTTLNLQPARATQPKCLNYKEVDWGDFSATLNNKLRLADILPDAHITSLDTLEKYVEDLMWAIQDTTAIHIPIAKPSPYVKRWWT